MASAVLEPVGFASGRTSITFVSGSHRAAYGRFERWLLRFCARRDADQKFDPTALAAAEKFLPRDERPVIDGFNARNGIIRDCYDGILSAPPKVRPRPFENHLETPSAPPEYLKELAFVAALQTILLEYNSSSPTLRTVIFQRQIFVATRQLGAKKMRVLPGFRLTLGYTLLYLSLIVLIPLAAVFWKTSTLSWRNSATPSLRRSRSRRIG